jgi:hypothetical protein
MTEKDHKQRINIMQALVCGFETANVALTKSSRFHFAECLDSANLGQLTDMVAFIEWSRKYGNEDHSPVWIATNLAHDIQGIHAQESCFSPRTSGYANILAAKHNKHLADSLASMNKKGGAG